MNTNKTNRKIKIRKFDPGAWKTNWQGDALPGTIGGVLGGATGVIQSSLNNANVKDTTDIESQIDNMKNYQFSALDNRSLMQEALSLGKMDRISQSDLTGDTWSKIKNLGSATLSGAQAGSAFGGIGAIVGAGVGLLGSTAGWIIGDTKAANKAKDLNADIEDAEIARNQSLVNTGNNIDNTMDMNRKLSILQTAFGGPIHTHGGVFGNKDITIINNGGTHEENPNGGIPVGIDNSNPEMPTLNTVEEGEVIFTLPEDKTQSFVFTNKKDRKPSKDLLQSVGLDPKYSRYTFAEIAKKLLKESEERPHDFISKAGKYDSLNKLIHAHEYLRMQKDKSNIKQTPEGQIKQAAYGDWLRVAGAMGPLVGLAGLQKPDFSREKELLRLYNNVPLATYTPVGTKKVYTPYDINTDLARMEMSSRATQNSLINTAGNAGAVRTAILANDFNNTINKAQQRRGLYQLNDDRLNNIIEYNNTLALQEAQRKDEINRYNLSRKLGQIDFMGDIYNIMDNKEQAYTSALGQNLSGLFTNIGAIGTDISNKAHAERIAELTGTKVACGGKIKRNKRKNLMV